MRRFLGAVLAIAFVALLAIDPLVCADGCREDGGENTRAAMTSCAICVGLGPAVKRFAVDPINSSLPSATAAQLWSEEPLTHLIEHPPQHT